MVALVSMLALVTLVRGVAICDASGVGGNDVAVVLVEAKGYWLRVNGQHQVARVIQKILRVEERKEQQEHSRRCRHKRAWMCERMTSAHQNELQCIGVEESKR